MSKGEVWKDVIGYEGFYKVSDRGNVYSVRRICTSGRKLGGHLLKPCYDKDGYLHVSLCKNGVMKTKRIHRLVAEAFTPNQNNYLEINHKDEDKTNNRVENLEWCTRGYNNNHGTRIERVSKKVRAVNIETGEVITFNSTQEAVRKGYSSGAVSQASRGIYNTGGGNLYKGHRWYYEEGE